MIVKYSENSLKKLSENEFKLEKDLQSFVEKNLGFLLDLDMIKSEFTIENYRFDTLAFDRENNSFVIIEYKKGTSYSVVDQGYAYLSTMLNNKAEFILEYNEKLDKTLKRNEVDWSQSKVLFISQNFTKYQKDTLNFKDLPIELYELKRYQDGIISFDNIKGNKAAESIKTISPNNETVEKVTKEIKTYTMEDHYSQGSEETIELFQEFREKIEEMIPNIEVVPKKVYIAFQLEKRNIIDFKLQKKQLKFWLNSKWGEIEDSKGLAENVVNKGHHGNGDYEITISDSDNLEYILSLVKQVYKNN